MTFLIRMRRASSRPSLDQPLNPFFVSLLISGLAVASPAPLTGQVDSVRRHPAASALADTLVKEARREVIADAHVVRAYEVAIALGGVGAMLLLDRPVQRFSQRHRSHTTDDIAGFFRQEGEAPYYAGISLGVLGLGIVTSNPGMRRAGGRLVASVAVSALESAMLKRLVGRSRPNENVGSVSFHPFTSLSDSAGVETRGAMPSGHTTAAFAVATSLADDIKSPAAKVLLFTFATGTAFSRINDNRHWLSDTALGALLGITTAKVVGGHWRIFGLKPPGFLVTPTGAPAVGWDLPI